VFRVFLLATNTEYGSPALLECVTLPCLEILRGLIGSQKQQQSETISYHGVAIDIHKWLQGDAEHNFQSWDLRAKIATEGDKAPSKGEVRQLFLAQKFGRRWLEKTFLKAEYPLDLANSTWLRSALFRYF